MQFHRDRAATSSISPGNSRIYDSPHLTYSNQKAHPKATQKCQK